MSLNSLYQNTKKDKKDATDRVLYHTNATELRTEIETIKGKLKEVLDETQRIDGIVRQLDALKMPEFTEKHMRMKDNFNKLVASYNETQTETNAVILDISKRLNDIEARL
jgi:hypothetical protein